MKSVERNLCTQCFKDTKAAQLICNEVPGRRQETDVCDWCGRSGMIRMVRIYYGRRNT